MTFRATMARLRRRWWILASGFLCFCIAAVVIYTTPTLYQAQAVLGGLAPPQPQTSNQLANVLQGELAIMQAVVDNLNGPDNTARLTDDGAVPGYSLSLKNTGTSETPAFGEPTVIIQVDSTDAQAALATVKLLTATYASQLQQLQTSLQVSPDQLVTSTVNLQPTVGDASGRPSQAAVGVLLGGIVFLIPFTLYCDTFLCRVAPGGLLLTRRLRSRRPVPQDG